MASTSINLGDLLCPLQLGGPRSHRCGRRIIAGHPIIRFVDAGEPDESFHFHCEGGHVATAPIDMWLALELASAVARPLVGPDREALDAIVAQLVVIQAGNDPAALLELQPRFDEALSKFAGDHRQVNLVAWLTYVNYLAVFEQVVV